MGWLDVGWLRDENVVVEAMCACFGDAVEEVGVFVRVAVMALVFNGIVVVVVKKLVGMRGVGIVVDWNRGVFSASYEA